MRAAAALLFSLLLGLTQALAALVPHPVDAPRAGCGCGCAQRACGTGSQAPVASGQAAPALAARRESAAPRVPARQPLLSVEASGCAVPFVRFSLPSPAFLQASVPSLFARHCALLL